jgi:putative ABC transport system permease protein
VKLKNLLKLSWLEITRYKSVTVFLVLNLALGLIGFFLLQIFQQSLVAQSAEKAQVILGGDISVSARRAFTDKERAEWESQFKFTTRSQFYSFFSMLRSATDSKLTSVGAFDSNYPLYGQFKLSDVGFSADQPRVWVDPEIQESMNLKLGDLVGIGETQFIFSGVILEDPTRLFRGTGFAPRVLIHKNYLEKAGLLKQGSTFSEYWTYKTSPTENLSAAKSKIEKVIIDPVVRIENTKDSAEDSNRVLRYFSDYLGLVALVALGLCFLCGSYLLQWTFLSKKKTIAIYKTLGLSDEKIILIYLLQNFIVSLMACLLGFVIVQSLQPLLQELLTEKFNLPLQLVFSPKAILFTNLIAIFGPMFIVIPQILQIIELRPLMLLQNIETSLRRGVTYFVWLGLAVFLFWGLAVWQSNSFKIASIFTVSLVVLIVLFQLINRLILYFLEKVSVNFGWLLKYAMRGLTRKKASAGLVFTTMSLSTLVLSLLPHVKNSIISEIRPKSTSQIPSLFMFDIQPEQVSGLQALSKQILQQDLVFSPLVRSRILKINEQNYERTVQSGQVQTREADEEARFRNRGLNLTYRDHLQDSEQLTDGVFSGVYSAGEKLPQVSLEKRYAERVNMKMGDIITFDVQGLELKAQVGSYRQVRWTSF